MIADCGDVLLPTGRWTGKLGRAAGPLNPRGPGASEVSSGRLDTTYATGHTLDYYNRFVELRQNADAEMPPQPVDECVARTE